MRSAARIAGCYAPRIPVHTLPIPHFDDLVLASGRSPAEVDRELRLLLAVKLYERGRVSSGRAAEVAGMSKLAFLDELARLGVPAIAFEPAQGDEFRDDD